MTNHSNDVPPTGQPIRDRREPPRGVLPRNLQGWLMAALALVIVLIILVANHAQPATRSSNVPRARPSTLPDADRIRAYQQQLVDDEARLQQVQQEAARTTRTVGVASTGNSPRTQPSDPVADETRRREVQSLFADNVAFSRRAGQPSLATRRASGAPDLEQSALSPETQAVIQALAASALRPAAVLAPPAAPAAVSPTPAPPSAASVPPAVVEHLPSVASASPGVVEHPAPGPRLALLQGTLIETVLLNRLDGTFAGPVTSPRF